MVKISIIIPVYNTEKYLSDCLESTLNQTLTDIEIICVNDGSTDNSLKILNEYAQKDSRIKVIDKKNEGAGPTRNTGIKHATGDYLYFLDSDDFIKETFCEKMYNQITKTNSDICICLKAHIYLPKRDIYPLKTSLKLDLIPSETFSRSDVPDILYVTTRSVMNKLYKRDLICSNNLYFQSLSSCNDVLFECSTLTLAKRITYINEALFVSRRNRDGAISQNRGLKIKNILLAMTEYKNLLISNNLLDEMEDILYSEAIRRFNFEMQFCNSILIKISFLNQVRKFLPNAIWKKYRNEKIKTGIKKLLRGIFSISNLYVDDIKYKKLIIFGISHKFKIQ